MNLSNQIEKIVRHLHEAGDPLLRRATLIDVKLATLADHEAEVARFKREIAESRASLMADVSRNYVESEIETADVMCNRTK